MKNSVLAALFLFMICDGIAPGPSQPTHFEILHVESGSTVTEPAYPCPSPLPAGYVCSAGDVLVHHDISGYESGINTFRVTPVVSVPGNVGAPGRYLRFPFVELQSGASTLNILGGLGLAVR